MTFQFRGNGANIQVRGWPLIPLHSPVCRIYFILLLFQLVSWSTTFPAFGATSPLYNSHEHFVYSLNTSTINNHVFSSERAWLVEFYSSWCGHCISFAPKWIQFADDLKEWRSVIVIAAIDCADEANVHACRQFEILGYPSLKMFPPHSPEQVKDSDGTEKLNIGEALKRPDSMTTLKNNVMHALEPMFDKLLGTSGATVADGYSSATDLWKNNEFSNGPPFLLLVYEAPESFVGLEVALRLSRYNKTVRVLRFHKKNSMYTHLGLDGWPAAGYLAKDGLSGSLILGKNQHLVDLLTTATIGLAKITRIEEKPEVEDAGQLHMEKKPVTTGILGEDQVSMEDLLRTIRNSLRNEVGLFQKLEGTKLGALKNFLGILTQYFPTDRREVKMFLVGLADWIRPQREIENVKYMEKLNELETEYNPWDIDLSVWYDCRATVPGRRGYSCGLWRLFHVLTVIGFEKHEDTAILGGIHGYVTEFFGCQECSKHFGEMVDRDDALQIRSIREQMLWLWKGHNEVNIRLKGTPSEDPGFPKGYYPTLKNCDACYITATTPEFDESKVEEYLVRIYATPKRYLDRNSGRKTPGDLNSMANKLRSNGSWLGGYFSLTDVGIFMMLYFSIALLLVFAYIHFKVARRRRFDPIFCLHRFCSRIFKNVQHRRINF